MIYCYYCKFCIALIPLVFVNILLVCCLQPIPPGTAEFGVLAVKLHRILC